MFRDGAVADPAALARLGHVSRARLTQIMNLLSLAPDKPFHAVRHLVVFEHLDALGSVNQFGRPRRERRERRRDFVSTGPAPERLGSLMALSA